MKPKLYIVLLASILWLSTFSCKKEDLNRSPYQDGGSNDYDYNGLGQTLFLVASDWELDQIGVYSHTFKDVLVGYGGKSVSVYLSTNGPDIPLYGPISYMNGTLSAALTPTDIKIVFRIYGPMPFSFVTIKVVID